MADDRKKLAHIIRCGAAIFLSSFLLFQVEPMSAKAMLPLFGGSASVWTASVLFFQLLLFVGYAFAHLGARLLGRRGLLAAYGVLWLGAVAVAWTRLLPSSMAESWLQSWPEVDVILVMAAHVGLPFLVLASTGPLMQWWSTSAGIGDEVYKLFALSNGASLAALVTYPHMIEPFMGLRAQAIMWATLLTTAFLLVAWIALLSPAPRPTGAKTPAAANAERAPDAEEGARSPSIANKLLWVGLSACGGLMMLASTNQLSLDVPSTPLLWVMPLSVYLVTFMLCFGREDYYNRRLWMAVLPAAAACELVSTGWGIMRGPMVLVVFHSATLFACCMVCHGELARMKPPHSELTGYYLLVSAGGALGGAFVALVAPLIFSGYWELNVGWVLAFVLALCALYLDSRSRFARGRPRAAWGAFAVVLVSLVVVAAASAYRRGRDAIVQSRSFHGIVRVDRFRFDDGEDVYWLKHNGVVHGCQIQSGGDASEPTAYYGRTSGVGRAIAALRDMEPDGRRRMDVGVVGLGAGVVAAYGERGDRFRFYEIDMEIVNVAVNYFSFLKGTEADTEMAPGDARLSIQAGLDSDDTRRFDLLVLDAFTGDTVPFHLLTQEALRLYKGYLKPDGVMAFHISSQFLDLAPLVCGVADSLDMESVLVGDVQATSNVLASSDWVLVTSNAKFIAHPAISEVAAILPEDADRLVFTDDRSSLVELLGKK